MIALCKLPVYRNNSMYQFYLHSPFRTVDKSEIIMHYRPLNFNIYIS